MVLLASTKNSSSKVSLSAGHFSQAHSSAIVTKFSDHVIKLHASYTKSDTLNTRMKLISDPYLQRFFVQPLFPYAVQIQDRLQTQWQRATEISAASPGEIDWEGAAHLLAELHSLPINIFSASYSIPAAGWLARLQRSYQRLTSALRVEKRSILAAFHTLPSLTSKIWFMQSNSFIHGDWHPGQLVFWQGQLRLIDIDDVGLGNPAWDLARPAAWYLSGLISNSSWSLFLSCYAEVNRNAFEVNRPWSILELPARAATVQAAATMLLRAEQEQRQLESYEKELINSCKRIAKLCT